MQAGCQGGAGRGGAKATEVRPPAPIWDGIPRLSANQLRFVHFPVTLLCSHTPGAFAR